ncbi:uncharacterized protein [Solanum tuberosum]|uniref:uncharacterized protein isoform X2 n=1 Tax=Solanum tuberosum TaxID=4113 RepID=UPI0003D24074|nr:PREDICTED: uncharacterized protein LOC102604717 isoform X2 [Solanum tuberosum]
MKCIINLHSPILLKFSTNKFTYQYHKSKPICVLEQQHYNTKSATGFVKGKRPLLIAPLKAVNSPAASGDLSVLLQTGNAVYVLDCKFCGARVHHEGSSTR